MSAKAADSPDATNDCDPQSGPQRKQAGRVGRAVDRPGPEVICKKNLSSVRGGCPTSESPPGCAEPVCGWGKGRAV